MAEIENVKIILVQEHMCNSVSISSLVHYFPLRHQNNKKEPIIQKSLEKLLTLEFSEIFKKVQY